MIGIGQIYFKLEVLLFCLLAHKDAFWVGNTVVTILVSQ
ncbi:unnamed protein product [Acidithrix sp. C25]|nr:unnamed protein product [Acidithrix sp. C25]